MTPVEFWVVSVCGLLYVLWEMNGKEEKEVDNSQTVRLEEMVTEKKNNNSTSNPMVMTYKQLVLIMRGVPLPKKDDVLDMAKYDANLDILIKDSALKGPLYDSIPMSHFVSRMPAYEMFPGPRTAAITIKDMAYWDTLKERPRVPEEFDDY